jgi:hypothetical protein
MNNAAAAPATTTAPATVAGTESEEDTMITTAAAALAAIEDEVAALMNEDEDAFDADLAARHEAALAAVRAESAQVKAVTWVVLAHSTTTRRNLRRVVQATSREDALAQARGYWDAKGARFLIDQVGEAMR